jgi:hypothetical protein
MDHHLVAGESSAAAEREDLRRSLQAAQCSLCSTLLPVGLMVPDGGQACADVRWYCKDARSCTERWTAHLSDSASAALPSAGVREIVEEQRPDAGFGGPPSEPVGAAEGAQGTVRLRRSSAGIYVRSMSGQ